MINYRSIIFFLKKHPVSSALIIINTVVLIYTIISGGFNVYNLYTLGAIHAPSIDIGEYYRLLFAMFLHGSVIHYLSNILFGLFMLGGTLERIIGSVRYFFVYMISGIGSSYFVYLSSGNEITIGASGAIYGILGVFLYIILFKKMITDRGRVELSKVILINVLFTFLTPQISIVGHVSGLLIGFFLAPLIQIKD